MGADDANEGNEPGACLEQEFRLARAAAGRLVVLRSAAAERRTARSWLADLTAEHGNRSAARAPAQQAYAAATGRWSELIRQAVAAGHTKADVARAAGCAAPSLYRHLKR